MFLLSDMSSITPSVVNKHRDPPLLLPFCLQSLSAHIVLKLSSVGMVPAARCFPYLPAVSSSGVQACPFICQWFHTSSDDQGKKWCNPLSYLSPFGSCSASLTSPHQLILIWGLFQAFLGLWKAQVNNFPVAMVMHHSQSCQQKSFQQHSFTWPHFKKPKASL